MRGVAKSYTASDGKLLLTLTAADEGGFVVTSPLEPELVTEAETIEDAFRMAHDALRALRASRVKLLRKLASPNQTTVKAIKAADRRRGKRFKTAGALFKDLGIGSASSASRRSVSHPRRSA